MNDNVLLFFIIAGEASGDLLGAGLIRGLKKLVGSNIKFSGIGGERMQSEGLETLFPQEDLTYMGIFEVLVHLPFLLRRIRQTVNEVKKLKPTALITIDSPDFNFRVAKTIKKEMPEIPLIHYVAPSVWAWRPGRARKIARFLDHLLALLPFEPPYFTREGLDCTFVGHPVVESGADKGNGESFRARYNIFPETEILVVLPGSRRSEINRLLPVFKDTINLLKSSHANLHVVIPTVKSVAEEVKRHLADWSLPVTVTMDDRDKYDAFAAAKAALACSGTVSVELAMARLPSVIAYKVNPLTAFLLRRMLKGKYVTIVNIMQDREIMPEFLQENCTPEKLAAAVHELLSNKRTHLYQKHELDSVAVWLGQGRFIPSERAARAVLEAVAKKGGMT